MTPMCNGNVMVALRSASVRQGNALSAYGDGVHTVGLLRIQSSISSSTIHVFQMFQLTTIPGMHPCCASIHPPPSIPSSPGTRSSRSNADQRLPLLLLLPPGHRDEHEKSHYCGYKHRCNSATWARSEAGAGRRRLCHVSSWERYIASSSLGCTCLLQPQPASQPASQPAPWPRSTPSQRSQRSTHMGPQGPPSVPTRKTDAYMRASLYLCLGMLYLKQNPMLHEPLKAEHLKKRLLGHWGSDSGQVFTYIHANRLIKKYDLNALFISGPGES
jgi:hypothetical protein